jgi:squalene synthase HpnC
MVLAQNPPLERAYAVCLGIARQHYENFPVASWLVPAPMRPHVAAVYAFARYADDFADEGEREPSERLALLDDWLTRLHAAVGGDARADSDDQRDLVFAAVAATMRSRDLPVCLFEELLSAFRQDVTVHRYETWATLLDYCRRSANPVGRLVLRIAGQRREDLDAASDNLCSALQLTNFLQDFDIDWRRGRLYVPGDMSHAYGARESDLAGMRLSAPWRAAIAEMVVRTRQMFDGGRSVCDAVGGRLGLELRFTWLGGRRILDRLESSGYDPGVSRPTLGLVDSLPIVWKAASWRRLP